MVKRRILTPAPPPQDEAPRDPAAPEPAAGSPAGPESAAQAPREETREKARPDRDALVWEADLPLLGRRMLKQWTLAMLVTALVMILLLGTLFAAQGDWDALPPMAAMAGAVTAGLWLLGLIIMAVLFRGRYRVRYTLTRTGLRMDTVEPMARHANTAAVVVGVLARSPQLLGAGLIAKSRESEAVRWSGAFQARPDPATHAIMLRNGWRELFWVQCTPENYAQVSAAITAHMARRRTASRVSSRSPLPAYLGRSALVLAASVPLFIVAEEYDTGLFLPILTLCFAQATVWLINLFGWVALGGLGLQALLVILAQFETRQSYFHPGETYLAYEVLGGEDFGFFLLWALGAGIITWLMLAALHGKWLAALVADQDDME